MAIEQPLFDISLPAAADLSSSQYLAVAVNSSGQAVVASTAGQAVVGINQGVPATAGLATTVRIHGLSKVVAGAAITRGAKVAVTAAGKVITAVPGDFVVGTCIVAAAADADICTILLGAAPKEEQTGFIDLGLHAARELSSNEYLNATGHGGLLANDTTPILEAVNPGTDGASRANWAASNSDEIAWTVSLPPDLDGTAAMTLHTYAVMSGATDTPTLTWEAYFNVGDTNCGGATAALSNTLAEQTVTIAAGDVPDTTPGVLTVTLTPGAHTTDALYLYGAWIEYTKI